jgi:thioredoxin reductase
MDVFEVQRFVAVVARPAQCCGLVLCAQVCPNGSLQIENEGANEPVVAAPGIASLDVPGVFFAGDVTGTPLIRNAVAQGTLAAEKAQAWSRARGPKAASVLDVVILGAGPAGLAAAIGAKRRGLSFVVLEQEAFAASIRSFPRAKLVLGASDLNAAEGELWLGDATKEELLARWTQVVRQERLAVEEHQKVLRVERKEGLFSVTSAGLTGEPRETVARSVIVALGRRGSPRKLEAPIDESMLSRVSYALVDAQSFAQQRVLVVGLGDVALEAVVALARQPGTSVTVVHRGEGLTRGRKRNVDAARRLFDQGVARIFFSASVARIGDGVADLLVAGKPVRMAVDRVLVLIGGEASLGMLDPLRVAGPTDQDGSDSAAPDGSPTDP